MTTITRRNLFGLAIGGAVAAVAPTPTAATAQTVTLSLGEIGAVAGRIDYATYQQNGLRQIAASMDLDYETLAGEMWRDPDDEPLSDGAAMLIGCAP